MGIIDTLPALDTHMGAESFRATNQDIIDAELALEVLAVEFMQTSVRLRNLEDQLFGNSACPPIVNASVTSDDGKYLPDMYALENTINQLGKLKEFVGYMISQDKQREGTITLENFKRTILSFGHSLFGETNEVRLNELALTCYKRSIDPFKPFVSYVYDKYVFSIEGFVIHWMRLLATWTYGPFLWQVYCKIMENMSLMWPL
jgi:hypothetical protein